MGIPTLQIEGRMLETSLFDEKDFYRKLEDFLEICAARKRERLS